MSVAETPRTIGHYEIERALGRGAIGTVYLARDTRIGRRVALKAIQLTERNFEDGTSANEFFVRLQREAELGGALHHPNIVTLYEAGYQNERVSFLAMEFVDGETLFDLMKRNRPGTVPLEIVLRIACDVLRGLVYAHANGIVHRDIKPANILIAADGSAKIADFGIARPQQSSLTVAGSLVGTPNYMSPEQVTGAPVSPRSDLFSLGVVLHEMLSGAKPFAANEIPVILHNILRAEPPRVPGPLGALVAQLLQKDPAARPSTDQTLVYVEAMLRSGARATSPAKMQRTISSRRATLVIAAAVALAVIPIAIIASRIDSTPTVTIPAAQLAEFEQKRRALDAADTLFNEGRYEESLRSYGAYLDRYPHSVAAEEGRDRAAQAIADVSNSPSARRSRADQDISPRELLRRIRRVFKR
ncbi:MAG TPA: serine/threonine-protein kinase [Thermoanaerobaculia bacterium]|nr:serine/threonine-protein kinase [Thermoanaerobaculia bacterium]